MPCRFRRKYSLMGATSIAACTDIANSFDTDRAERTCGAESLRCTSGCRAAAACSERPPPADIPANENVCRCHTVEEPDRRRLRKRHRWQSGKSGEARFPRSSSSQCVRVVTNQLRCFLPPVTCCCEAAITRRGSGRVASAGRFPARSAGGGDAALECVANPPTCAIALNRIALRSVRCRPQTTLTPSQCRCAASAVRGSD